MADRQEKMKKVYEGEGVYIYQNNTNGELSLPKAALDGRKRIGVKGTFKGDSYFMSLVKPPMNLLKLIEIVNERKIMEETLILDQPDRITREGKTEQVQKTKKMNLVETENLPSTDVLLLEDPMGGVEIITE